MRAAGECKVSDGDRCAVIRGTHAGKSGTVRDIKLSRTGHVTITVVEKGGRKFKTLARNVLVDPARNA
jgi:ribosomal protein S4E